MSMNRQFILNGKLPKVMREMSWPAVVAMVLYGPNNFLDGIFVGHLIDNTALAAAGAAYPLARIYGIRSIYMANAVIDWIILGMVIYAVWRSSRKLLTRNEISHADVSS